MEIRSKYRTLTMHPPGKTLNYDIPYLADCSVFNLPNSSLQQRGRAGASRQGTGLAHASRVTGDLVCCKR